MTTTAQAYVVVSHDEVGWGNRFSVEFLVELADWVRLYGEEVKVREELSKALASAGAGPRVFPCRTALDYGILLTKLARCKELPTRLSDPTWYLGMSASGSGAGSEPWTWTSTTGVSR